MSKMSKGQAPGEAAGDGEALHGSPSEVTWDEGRGRQPYSNRGSGEQGPATAKESEAGDRGSRSGVNLEQLEDGKKKP